MGICTAAFCQAMLEGDVEPGVWFPEEKNGIYNKYRKRIESLIVNVYLCCNILPFKSNYICMYSMYIQLIFTCARLLSCR